MARAAQLDRRRWAAVAGGPLVLAVSLLLLGGSGSPSPQGVTQALAARAPVAPLHVTTPVAAAAGSSPSKRRVAAAAESEGAAVLDWVLSRRGGAKGASSSSPLSGGGGKRGAGAGKGKGRPVAEVLDEDEDDDDEDDEDDEEEWDDEEEYEEEEDGEYEEEEEEYEEEEEEHVSRGRGSSGGQRRRGPANDWHYADRRRRMRARRSNAMGISGLVKGAAKFTGNSVSKVAGLFQPNKYVGLREIIGVWKMKQKVSERPGELERCEATVEIRKDGSVVTFFEGQELLSEFLFKERQWPRSCIIEFEAKAFQGPYDREPQLMFYKGYVKRGLVNSKQVRIEGKIYDVKGTFFWRQKKQVGRFRAIKR